MLPLAKMKPLRYQTTPLNKVLHSEHFYTREALILILRFLFGLTPQIFKFWDEKNACKFLAWSDYFWAGARRSKSSGFGLRYDKWFLDPYFFSNMQLFSKEVQALSLKINIAPI